MLVCQWTRCTCTDEDQICWQGRCRNNWVSDNLCSKNLFVSMPNNPSTILLFQIIWNWVERGCGVCGPARRVAAAVMSTPLGWELALVAITIISSLSRSGIVHCESNTSIVDTSEGDKDTDDRSWHIQGEDLVIVEATETTVKKNNDQVIWRQMCLWTRGIVNMAWPDWH